jgi:secreted PhoX family phosphatase
VSSRGDGPDAEDGEDRSAAVHAGQIYPFAKNAFSDDEFAGATFSPDGDTLFVNIQGQPALTFAITGPWAARRR